MTGQKKSLCIFIHFSEQDHIPYYVQIYANELSRFFDEVVLLSNIRPMEQLPVFSDSITIQFQENKGYDFGRFYNYYRTINKEDYYRIGCINDSNILINKLDHVLRWDIIDQYDFWGMVDSYEKPWFSTAADNYHLQSHFLIFNQKAIDLLEDYFRSVEINDFFDVADLAELRRKVIDRWEIGLSQFMKTNEMKIGHFINCHEVTQQFNMRADANITHKLYQELLSLEYPLVKKKAFFDEKKLFRSKEALSKQCIRKYGNPDWPLDELMDELDQMKIEYSNKKQSKLLRKLNLYLHRQNNVPGLNEKSDSNKIVLFDPFTSY